MGFEKQTIYLESDSVSKQADGGQADLGKL